MENVVEAISCEYSSLEKEKCIELIKIIVKLSNKAYIYGILSLEDEYRSLSPFLLRKGIELIVEGFYVKDLRKIMDNYINAQKYYGIELLEKIIIREGVLLIQNGDSGKILLEKILSMLGEGFFKDIDEIVFDDDIALVDRRDKEINSIFDEAQLFENKIMQITDSQDMEKLMRKSGYFYMALALKGSSVKLNTYVRNRLSLRYIVDELNHEIKRIGSCKLEDIIDAQKFILSLF